MQGVRWDTGGTIKEFGLQFFLWQRKRKSSIGNKIFAHHRIVSAVTRVEFVSDRVLYIVSGRRCNIIVLNVHASSEEKNDDSKDSFYEELEQVFLIILLRI